MPADNKDLSSAEAKRRERRINRRSQVMVLGALVLFIVLTLLILDWGHRGRMPLDAPGSLLSSQNLKLSAYLESEQGIEDLRSQPRTGDVLVFRVSSSHPLHAALVMALNETEPVIVFPYARIPPGKNKLVQTLNEHYRYRIGATDKRLRFCLLHQSDRASLNAELRNIRQLWPKIDGDACVQLK